ncbi:MAG: nucleoside deaminase [bacterium]
MPRDNPFPELGMNWALEEAKRALEEGEVPVGAVVVKDGMILGRGHNRTKALSDPTAHAEIIAITAAAHTLNSDHLEGCDLYVTLEPCPMCAGASVLARIARIFYAVPDPRMGACGSVFDIARDPRLPHKIEIYAVPHSSEISSQLLKTFFAELRNRSQ